MGQVFCQVLGIRHRAKIRYLHDETHSLGLQQEEKTHQIILQVPLQLQR